MDGSNGVNGQHLQSFIERIERIEGERKVLADDIKDVYAEAKGTGFDPKIIKKVVSLRKMDKHKREEEEAILELYLSSLGMLAETPLGQAAVAREFGR